MKTYFWLPLILINLAVSCTEDKTTASNNDIIDARNAGNNHSSGNTNEKGKKLFMANCASCHNPTKDATGPALKGSTARVPSKDWIYKWVSNPAQVIASGDKYAAEIYTKWNKTAMTAFPNLSHEDIDAIMAYVDEE